MAIDSAEARLKIESVKDLPTLPSVAGKIVSMVNSPNTNAADIGKMIEQDQALTSKVLKIVNSAFYGFPGQIKSIQHAVVILGFNKVKSIIMAAAVFNLTTDVESDQLDIQGFWVHCLGTAIAAKVAAKYVDDSVSPDDAFVGGLVHDMGKLILSLGLNEEYGPVMLHVKENEKVLIKDVEQEILGFDHATVGYWIGQKWSLPASLLNIMRFHHDPLQAREGRELISTVYLGDAIARAIGLGNPGDDYMAEISPAVLQMFEIDLDTIDKILEGYVVELGKAQEFFDLIKGDE